MSPARMHPGQVDVDAPLVRRLLAAQLPQWADLPLEPVRSTGTVNAMYRLGPDLAVRLPLLERWSDGLAKELEWLPVVRPRLPVAVPEPVAAGEPGEGYPFRWAVYRWLDGEPWDLSRVRDPCGAAEELAAFVHALHRLDTTGAPEPRRGQYGGPLADRLEGMRWAVAAADGMVDTRAVAEAWEAALQVPAWDRPPVWVHGDLLPGNLLVRDGRLRAVIDWGSSCAGDPACDVQPAWTLFTGESRDVYRSALGVDDATWERGRGWALTRVMNVAYYAETNPLFAADAQRTITEALADRDPG